MARGVPGIFVAGTDAGVGKTAIASGLAKLWRKKGRRVGVFKPIAVGCSRRARLGLMSDDAECLAYNAESELPLDVINPIRYAPQLVPMAAAEQTKIAIDFDAMWRAYEQVCHDADVVIVEEPGGLLMPLERKRRVADLAAEFGFDILLVARSGLGAVNQVLLHVEVARARGLRIAGIILNAYHDRSPELCEETAAATISRCARGLMPLAVPQDDQTNVKTGQIGPKVVGGLAHLGIDPRPPKKPTR